MREDYTHLTIVLDRSGSMGSCKQDTIGGFNTFLEKQKTVPGKMTVSMVQFDDEYEKLYDFVDVNEVAMLNNKTFEPRGSTRLRDALARAIDETGDRLAAMAESQRPTRVVVLTLTDGGENASRKCTPTQLDDRVEVQKGRYSWDFIFIGADLDSFTGKQCYGNVATGDNSLYAGKAQMLNALNITSAKLASYRGTNVKSDLSYSDEERASLS